MKTKTKKKLLAGTLGAFDPILRRWAQGLASRIPEKSIARSTWFESALGVLKGFIEASADALPPAAWATIEKATDFGDFFAGALGSKSQPTIEHWMQSFLSEAIERLRLAENPEAESKNLERELELRLKLGTAIQEKSGVYEEKWGQKFAEKFRAQYTETNKILEEKARTLEERSREKKKKGGYRI